MNSAYLQKRFIVFLVPLYTVIMCFVFFAKQWPFYLNQPDPCYCYLFNGINLASGNMEIGHIDHPGTPVQCFAAAIIFIKHLFSSSPTPLFQDAIVNAESYLYVCSIVLILLFVCTNYLTGAYIFRNTKSVGLSLLFQLLPLININIIQRSFVLGPESFIIITATFFMAYLYVKASGNSIETAEHPNTKTVIIFGIFSGFLIASKYTCVPVILLVLFLLKKNKSRLLYVVTTIVSFFFCIIPALPKFKNMYRWVWSLASHDGIYGKGAKRVVDPSLFFQNLKGIFITDAIFTSIYCVITAAFFIVLVKWFSKKKNTFLRPVMGVWVSITALILIVAKHCDFHYLIFAECCFPFGMAVSYKIFSGTFTLFRQAFKQHEKKIVYAIFGMFIMFLVIEKIRYLPSRHPAQVSVDRFTDDYKAMPLIISVKDGLACGRKEPALYLGYLYAGNLQGEYAEFLKSIYPNTYIYWNSSQTLTYWNEAVPITTFLNKNKKVLIYLKGYDDAAEISLMQKFCAENINLKCDEQEIYKDPGTLQNICLISNNQ